jgi:uncharacterized LabA/DUF88 family protein
MPDKLFAILIDGGFFQKEFKKKKNKYPDANDTEAYCRQFGKSSYFQGFRLYRIFYYGCIPTREIKQNNPLDTSTTKMDSYAFSVNTVNESATTWKTLMGKPYFAMRQGTLKRGGWKLAENVLTEISNKRRPATLVPGDIQLNVNQKQVDLKIGMDVAHLAFKNLVKKIILVTNDADLAPAAKLARVEGLQVYLDSMNETVPEELMRHTDVVIPTLI